MIFTALLLFYSKAVSQCEYNESEFPYFSSCKPTETGGNCSFECLPQYKVKKSLSETKISETCKTSEICISPCQERSQDSYQDYSSFCTYVDNGKLIAFVYDQYDTDKVVCRFNLKDHINTEFEYTITPDIFKAHFMNPRCKKGYYLNSEGGYKYETDCPDSTNPIFILTCLASCKRPNVPNAVFSDENPPFILERITYAVRCPNGKIFNDQTTEEKTLECQGLNNLSNYPISCIEPNVLYCNTVNVNGNPDYNIPDNALKNGKFKNGQGLKAPEFYSWSEDKQVDYEFIICNSAEEAVTLSLYKVICPLIEIEKNGNEDKILYSEKTDPDSFSLNDNKFSGNVTITVLDGFTINGKLSLIFSCSYNRDEVPQAHPSKASVIARHCPLPTMNLLDEIQIIGNQNYIEGETTIITPDYISEDSNLISDNSIKVHCVKANTANVTSIHFTKKQCSFDKNDIEHANYDSDCFDSATSIIDGKCKFTCDHKYYNPNGYETVCHNDGNVINPAKCIPITCEKKNVPKNYHGFWSGKCNTLSEIENECEYKCEDKYFNNERETFILKCEMKDNVVIPPEPLKCEQEENLGLIIGVIVSFSAILLVIVVIALCICKSKEMMCFKKKDLSYEV